MNASDCDILLETQLPSDPTAPARLFTVLQGLLTPTAQRSPRNVVYLHRGINPSKRLFFQALCAALGRSNTSYRSGCGWVTSENMHDAARILNSGATGRYPQLLVLDGIPSGSLVEWRHLMSLAATPAVQIHILQDIAWPHEPPLFLSSGWIEQFNWRDTTAQPQVSETHLWPALAAWLGIVADRDALTPPSLHTSPSLSDGSSAATIPRIQQVIEAVQRLPNPNVLLVVNSNHEIIGQTDWTKPPRTIADMPTPLVTTASPACGGYTVPASDAPPEAAAASAQTMRPGEAVGDCISIMGVRLPLAQLTVGHTDGGATLVQFQVRLVSTDDWRSYQSIRPRLIPSGLCDREVLPVEHPTLRTWGVEALLFTRLGFPLPTLDGYMVEMEGVRLPQKLHANPLGALAAQASRTAIYPGAGTGSPEARLYTALGLAGEAGEVAGKASKMMRDGASPALDAALHKELSDVLWFWFEACQEWGAAPDKIAHDMLTRLQDRQARGVLKGSGDDR